MENGSQAHLFQREDIPLFSGAYLNESWTQRLNPMDRPPFSVRVPRLPKYPKNRVDEMQNLLASIFDTGLAREQLSVETKSVAAVTCTRHQRALFSVETRSGCRQSSLLVRG